MKSRSAVAPFGLWMFMFTIVPLGIIVYFAGTDAEGVFTFATVLRIFDYAESFGYSILVGVISTAVCLVLAYPIAFSISRCSERMQRTAVMLIMLPMWMNSLLRIIALSSFLGEKGYINQFLGLFGLNMGSLLGTHFAIILGTVYDFLPFMILPIYTTLSKLDGALREAAMDLGADDLHTFLQVTLPLSVPGIVSGVSMVFLPAMTNYVVLDMLYNSTYIMGSLIGSYFSAYNWHGGSMIALILLAIICLFTLLTTEPGEENERGGALL